MATTLNLQNSINFVTPILKNQPLLVSGMEPALTAGNIVLGVMLGPPCKWRFNRSTFNFPVTKAGGTDYSKLVSDLGSIESMWIKDGAGNVVPLEGAISLPVDSSSSRPTKIAPQYDDNAGNITFRLDHTPDQSYTVYCDYQRKAGLMIAPASPWGVVSDEFAYIYQYGFMSLMMLLVNDSRFPIFEQYFISKLLGAQDGLTDQEKNIFVANWMALAATLNRTQGNVNSGVAGRGK